MDYHHKPAEVPKPPATFIARAIAFCIACWGLSFVIAALRWW